MGIRNQVVSVRFLQFLQRNRAEIKHETLDIQHGLACLLESATWKQREHRTEPGCVFISFQEIYERFGRANGLEIVTTRYGIFETTGDYSVKSGVARAFKVADDLAEGIKKHHRAWRRTEKPCLILSSGKEFVAPLAAIDSLDMGNRHAKAAGKTLVENFVPVPRQIMHRVDNALQRLSEKQLDLFAGDDLAEIEKLRVSIGQVMGNTMVHEGVIGLPHRYVESDAGRLYGQGMHLQNTRRAIKNMILSGRWEYDVENCHYSILYQLAAKFGLDLPAVGHYLCWKKEVREQLMLDIGIAKDDAKTCLIALIYGARNGKREIDDAIPRTIGIDAAQRLYDHELWIRLKADVTKARDLLIKKWPRSRGRLENLMGKWISETQTKPKILAHLLQGVESKMLEVVRTMHPHALVLMQHDGFSSYDKLDVKAMEDEITVQTGFIIELSEQRLNFPSNIGICK